MNDLQIAALILGVVLAVLSVPMVFIPGRILKWIQLFPRNRWMGWILAGIDLFWVGWLLFVTPLPWFEPFKKWLYVAVPVVFVLVVTLMNELLAARSLGGLFLLVPAPLLQAAFMHPSRWRWVVVVLAYIMAIKGMLLILSPFKFRKVAERFMASERGCRVWGSLALFVGAVVIGLAVTVY